MKRLTSSLNTQDEMALKNDVSKKEAAKSKSKKKKSKANLDDPRKSSSFLSQESHHPSEI